MSMFRCEVVPVKLEPHPNANTLSIVRVWGYTVVVKTAEWAHVDRGVYIPPDSVVPYGDRFNFLFKTASDGVIPDHWGNRITVRRFRGVYSEGLLMPLEKEFEYMAVGEDRALAWGITHYEPPIKYQTTGVTGLHQDYSKLLDAYQVIHFVPSPPGLLIPKYDVENFKRYGDLIPEGTPVYVTEKIHGCNARFVYVELPKMLPPEDGQMFVGSRTNWKADSGVDPWHQCLKQNPWIEDWCHAHPNMVLYGEVFGQVQDLKYGAKNGQLFFRAFDVFDCGRWLNYAELEEIVAPAHRAPVVFLGPFDEKLVREIVDRDSVVCPGQCAEGVVICPLVEMNCHKIGRIQLKLISNRYLERAK